MNVAIIEDLEGSNRGAIAVISRNWPRMDKKTQERTLDRTAGVSRRRSNPVPPEYKSKSLSLDQILLYYIKQNWSNSSSHCMRITAVNDDTSNRIGRNLVTVGSGRILYSKGERRRVIRQNLKIHSVFWYMIL
jgi:hypothetical protein